MRPLTFTGSRKAAAELFANLPPADCSLEQFGQWLSSHNAFLAVGVAISFALPIAALAMGLR
ncbi:MAG TPA: hypothetical protein VGN97_12170 [Mesorhizobium sp.]|jgi:hypothetical protein|nr:hypothetical protein [Mesorhizobium sp.]